jgi:hypothetical protein
LDGGAGGDPVEIVDVATVVDEEAVPVGVFGIVGVDIPAADGAVRRDPVLNDGAAIQVGADGAGAGRVTLAVDDGPVADREVERVVLGRA